MSLRHAFASLAFGPTLALGLGPLAASAACIDAICFVDRGATGEIVTGNQRGGVAVLDFDGDGRLDLVFANVYGVPNRLFRNVPAPGVPGGRSFVDATPGSGLDDAEGTARRSQGVVAGDVDADGDPDVYFTGEGQDGSSGVLYRNDGGVFVNVSVASGVRATAAGLDSASFTDYDLDGDLDLFVAGGGAGRQNLRLLRNRGNGVFDDASAILPAIATPGVVYAALFTDYDDDGDPDGFLITPGPSPGPTLLRNDVDASGARVFVEVHVQAGFLDVGPVPMGIAAGDFDDDGDRDLAVSNGLWGTYFRNDGGGRVTAVEPFRSIWGWGIAWIDADNDGDLDHYQAGSLGQRASAGGPAQADRLFRNLGGGTFDDVSPALNGTVSASQYAVQLDWDDDGRRDLVTLNPGVPGQFTSFYHNESPSNHHWLVLKLEGDGVAVNREAVGAVVRVRAGARTIVREIVNGSSTSSTEDLRVHVGLGTRAFADEIEVRWPRAGTIAERTEIFPGPIAVDRILALSPGASSTQCHDGLDNDGDGRVDHPADLGCASAASPSESPACENGLDDDADGRADWPADPGCTLPSRDSEIEPTGCGLGVELLPLALLASAWRGGRRGPRRTA